MRAPGDEALALDQLRMHLGMLNNDEGIVDQTAAAAAPVAAAAVGAGAVVSGGEVDGVLWPTDVVVEW